MDLSKLRIAIVTDQMYSRGGADRLMESIWKGLPQSDVYATYFNSSKYPEFSGRIHSILKESFIIKLLFKYKLTNWFATRTLNVLTPVLVETLDLSKYDLAISISARAAKGIITGLDTCHISIINTPPRFEWDKDESIKENKAGWGFGALSYFISTFFRIWDRQAFDRADYIISISKFISLKVKKYYQKESEVIYPAIKNFWLRDGNDLFEVPEKDYFFIQSRLFDAKRLDVAIRAALKAKVTLIIAGEGPEKSRLQKIAGSELNKSIIFKGFVPDVISKAYYTNAKAFIFPAIEDFGIVPVESLACGTPVIAYNYGGLRETVVNGTHGVLFDNEKELVRILQTFDKKDYDKSELKKQASKFSEDILIEKIQNFVRLKYGKFKTQG
jgi:glycosyltransferase involved in cell wall biosynthesis